MHRLALELDGVGRRVIVGHLLDLFHRCRKVLEEFLRRPSCICNWLFEHVDNTINRSPLVSRNALQDTLAWMRTR